MSPGQLLSDSHQAPTGGSGYLPEGMPRAFVALILYRLCQVLASREASVSAGSDRLLTDYLMAFEL